MSAKEKENLVSLISTIIVSLPYLIYVFTKHQNSEFTSAEEIKFWASSILLLIPLRIVTQILVYIFFSIGKAIATGEQKESTIVDERDKLIELKGDRNSTNTFTFGVIASMIAVIMGGSIATMFGIIILSGFMGEVIGIFSKIYYYKKGI